MARPRALLSPIVFRLTGEALPLLCRRRASTSQETDFDLGSIRRILILKLDEIGDVVLASPFIREVRRTFPDAAITLVVKPATADLTRNCPYVDRVLTYAPSANRRAGVLSGLARARRFSRAHLADGGLDLAFIPRWDLDERQAVFVAYWSDATHRVGYSERVTEARSLRNRGHDHLLTRAVTGTGVKHDVERNLDLLAAIGGDVQSTALELWPGEQSRERAAQLVGGTSLENASPLVAFGVGAGHPKRRWPPERFRALADRILDRWPNAGILLLGSVDDRPAGAEIASAEVPGIVDLTGSLTLIETGAVLDLCDLYVGNDSGVMHIAAAAGTRVVEISCHPLTGDPGHGNSPARFGPWGPEQAILRPRRPVPPCSTACTSSEPHCICTVEIDEVEAAITGVLSPRDVGVDG